MLASRHEGLKRAVNAAVEKLQAGENYAPLVEEILTRVIHKVIGQYQDKVNVGMQDSLMDLLSAFKQKVESEIFDAKNRWRVRCKDSILFPPNCRYCYTRGKATVAVIEQQPMVRTLLFDKAMLDHRHEFDSGATERISLALPYVYFFMHFQENGGKDQFQGVYSMWSTKSLKTMDDPLSLPLLPNTHSHGNICLGWAPAVSGGTIVDLTASAISFYWGSTFNSHLTEFWWNKANIDRRLETAKVWAKNSEENPMFILNVKFPVSHTVDDVIRLLTKYEQEPDELHARNDLNEAIDKVVETLYLKIGRYFKKTKFDKFYPKETTDKVSDALVSVIEEMTDVLLALEHEINEFKDDLMDLRPHRWKKRGELWQD